MPVHPPSSTVSISEVPWAPSTKQTPNGQQPAHPQNRPLHVLCHLGEWRTEHWGVRATPTPGRAVCVFPCEILADVLFYVSGCRLYLPMNCEQDGIQMVPMSRFQLPAISCLPVVFGQRSGRPGVAQLCPLLRVPTAKIQASTTVTPSQGLRNIFLQARSGRWSRPVPWGAGLKCLPWWSLARAGLAPGGPPTFRARLSPKPLQQGWVESVPCMQSLPFLLLPHLSDISQRQFSASRGPV